MDELDDILALYRQDPVKRTLAPKENDKQFRDFFTQKGFKVNRTFGKAINKGSLHPYGLAADIDFNGKSDDEIGDLVESALQKGYRVFDERVKQPGVKQTGPHLHFERNNGNKPSSFLQGRYGKKDFKYLTDLDNARLGKGSAPKQGESLDDLLSLYTTPEVPAQTETLDDIIGLYAKPSPTNPVNPPKINVPAPEAPETIQSQIQSTLDPNSPKKATLITPGEQIPTLGGLEVIDVPEGKLAVNPAKGQPRSLADAIGKVQDVGNNTRGMTVLTTDAQGNELSASIVRDPKAAAEQVKLDKQMYPQAVNHELLPSEEVARRRSGLVGRSLPSHLLLPNGMPEELNSPNSQKKSALLTPGKELSAKRGRLKQKSARPYSEEDYKAWADFNGVSQTPETRKSFEMELTASAREGFGKGVQVGANAGDFTVDVNGEKKSVTDPGFARVGETKTNRQIGTPTDDLDREIAVTTVDAGTSPEDKMRLALQSQLSRYGVMPDEIEAYIQSSSGQKDLKRIGSNITEIGVAFSVLKDIKGEDAARYQIRREQSEARPFIDEGVPQDSPVKPTGDPLRDQALQNILSNPLSGGTDADIEAEYRRLQRVTPTAEETASDIELGKSLRASDQMGATPGVVSGLIESVLGRGSELASGLYQHTTAALGNRIASYITGKDDTTGEALTKFAQRAKVVGTNAKGDGVIYDVGNFVGQTAGDVPRLIGMTALTGGNPIIAFGLDETLRSGGRGETLAEQVKHGAKGAILGAIFHGGSKLGEAVENGLVKAILPSNSVLGLTKGYKPKSDIELVAKLAGEGTRIGTIGAGTFGTAKLEGATNEEALKQAALMLLTDLAFNNKKYGEFGQLSNKVFRLWKNGEYGDFLLIKQKGETLDVIDVTNKVPKEAIQADIVAKDRFDQAKNITPKKQLPGETRTAQDRADEFAGIKDIQKIADEKTEATEKPAPVDTKALVQDQPPSGDAPLVSSAPVPAPKARTGTNASGSTWTEVVKTKDDGSTKTTYDTFRPDGRKVTVGRRQFTKDELLKEFPLLPEYREDFEEYIEKYGDKILVREIREAADGRGGITLTVGGKEKGIDHTLELAFDRNQKPSAPVSETTQAPGGTSTAQPNAAEPKSVESLLKYYEEAPTDLIPEAPLRPSEKGFEIVSETGAKATTPVGQLKEQRDEERRKGNTDKLTGLANQNAWETAKERIEADPEQEVISIDVNRMKDVNDTTSHEGVNKTVLKPIGDAVQKVLEKHGIDARNGFRTGGDEFTVAVPKGKAQQVRDDIEKAFGVVNVTAEKDFTNTRTGESFKKGDIIPVTISGSFGNTVKEAEVELGKRKEESKKANPVTKVLPEQSIGEDIEKRLRDAGYNVTLTRANTTNTRYVSVQREGQDPIKIRISDHEKGNLRSYPLDIRVGEDVSNIADRVKEYIESDSQRTREFQEKQNRGRQWIEYRNKMRKLGKKVPNAMPDNWNPEDADGQGLVDRESVATHNVPTPTESDQSPIGKDKIKEAPAKVKPLQKVTTKEEGGLSRELTTTYGSNFAPVVQSILDSDPNIITESNDVNTLEMPSPKEWHIDAVPKPVFEPEGMSVESASLEMPAPAFFSQVERTIEQKMPNKASADQIKGLLKDAKKEELEWLDIDTFLKDNPNPTKQEVLDYVRANNAVVEEVTKEAVQTIAPKVVKQWGNAAEGFEGFLYKSELGEEAKILKYEDGRAVLTYDGGKKTFPSFDEAYEALKRTDRFNQKYLGDDTKFSQYTLPGGENYRELLLTMPDDSARGANYRVPSGHGYGDDKSDKNRLAHVRFDERDGGKTLHVAEIQSDWHQAGRKKGYAKPNDYEVPLVAVLSDNTGYYEVSTEDGRFVTNVTRSDGGTSEESAIAEARRRLRESPMQTARIDEIPNAPFKTSWPLMAFKRVLRYAVENGYERVTFDTGETNAERYDLSKQVESITVTPARIEKSNRDIYIATPSQNFTLIADADGRIIETGERNRDWAGKLLEDVVGKDMAEKIMQAPPRTTFKGNDLKVGGEGMKAFYDRILPSEINKYVKKWGGRVEAGKVGAAPVHSLTITPAMKDAVMAGQTLFMPADSGSFKLQEDAQYAHPQDLLDRAKSSITDDGHIELNVEAGELLRRIAGKPNAFFGLTHTRGTLIQLSRKIDQKLDEFRKAGYSDAEIKVLADLADQLREVAKNGAGITYIFDFSLPHETHHQMVLNALNGETIPKETIDELSKLKVWNNPKIKTVTGQVTTFSRLYPRASGVTKAMEIAAMLDTGEITHADKNEFLKIFARGIKSVSTVNPDDYIRIFQYDSQTSDTGRSEAVGSEPETSGSTSEDRQASPTKEEANQEAGTRPGDGQVQRPDSGTEVSVENKVVRQLADYDRLFKKRQYAETLRENGYEDTPDVPYIPDTEKKWLEDAQRRISASKHDDYKTAEKAFYEDNMEPQQRTALGIGLLDHLGSIGELERMIKVSEELVKHVGTAAQALRASQLAGKYDFVTGMMIATRAVKKAGKELTAKDAEKVRELLTRIAQTEEEKASLTYLNQELETAVKEADKNIKELEDALNEAQAERKVDEKTIARLKRQIATLKENRPRTYHAKQKAELERAKPDLEKILREAFSLAMPAPDTDAFKKWFGNSKVVDADGKPLVVFRGGIRQIDDEHGPTSWWFSNSPQHASDYAGDSGTVVPAYLKLERPTILDAKGGFINDANKFTIVEQPDNPDGTIILNVFDPPMRPGTRSTAGIGTVYRVDNRNQIKSAIGNKGTFDPNNPSILEMPADDRVHNALVDMASLDILNYVSPEDTIEHLRDLTNNMLSEDELREIHLEAFEATKTESNITPEARKNSAIRMAHRRMAMQTAKPDVQKVRERPSRYDKEVITFGRNNGYTDKEILGAILFPKIKGAHSVNEWKKLVDGDDDTFKRSRELRQKVNNDIQDQIIKAKADREGYKGDLEKFKNEVIHNGISGREARKAFDAYARRLSRSLGRKAFDLASETVSLFKGLSAWGEISYIGRQGFIPLLTDTRAAIKGDWKGVGHGLQGDNKLWQYLADKGGFENAAEYLSNHSLSVFVEQIRQHPRFLSAQNNGVRFTQIGDFNVADDHFSTQLLEKVPFYRRAEAAYTLPGDLQRLYIYDNWATMLEQQNLSADEMKKALKYVAETVNAFTGKGDIGKVIAKGGALSKVLNLALFSPQLLFSRFQSLNKLTLGWATAPKGLKMHMAKKGLRFYGILAVIAALTGMVIDPEDEDFGKINKGDTHLDILAGLDVPAQLYLRTAMGFVKSVINQDTAYLADDIQANIREFGVSKEGQPRFVRSKLSPGASLAVDAYTGTDFIGRPFTWWGGLTSRSVPLAWQQTYDALLYDRYREMVKEPRTFEYAVNKFNEHERNYLNALMVMAGTFTGIGITQYPKADRTKAVQLAAQLSPFVSKKDAEQRRIEGGLRSLLADKFDLLKQGKDTRKVDAEIERWMRINPDLNKKFSAINSQAGSKYGLLSLYLKDLNADQLKRVRSVSTDPGEIEIIDKRIKSIEK